MSTFDAHEAFVAWHMRTAFLAGCDDFALHWAMWCMGGEL